MTTGGAVIYEYYGNLYAGAASNSLNEEWRYRTETHQIIVSSNNQCLDAYKDSASGEYRVHVYPCEDINRNQYWTIDSARQRIRHLTHPNLCLDVDPTQNNKVQVWTCYLDAPNQRIMVTEDAIKLSAFNGRYLASDQGIARFVDVWGEPIEWIVSTVDLTWRWRLQFFSSNECLDAYEPWNGGTVHTWPCDSNNGNQKWRYDPATGQLRHATHTGFCLDMSTTDFNMEFGTRPYLWERKTPANKLQVFTYESQRFEN
ncbi:hypothetical protein SDRG_16165 [Saprolegnia diclina VS20]|uniref:Ricin B lectin domain-containing protein n=1 Tax=Saprolegnia diclina (strain VS20) TaxID=1156394 RepID=T0R1Y7_SAPDV|nr:hypothetical protein SDRG_16165 [Saprolegnia diclina VS20]EQC26018.1 hypothetical protein SDRG_16165 [Saprolegnia diclina VS20]|eukprot:XP_008620586.1 hypothetical protein SDRG_16165 [Saprolegnia diclina VS20]